MTEENQIVEEQPVAQEKKEGAQNPKKKPKTLLVVLIILGIIAAIVIGIVVAGQTLLKKAGVSSFQDLGGKVIETAFYKDCMKEQNDKDLCKYMSNFKDVKNMSAKTVNTFNGKVTESTWESEDDSKTSVVSSADGKENFAMIVIGDTSYTKDYTDNKWWKVTNPEELEKITDEVKPDSKEKLDKAVDQVTNTVTYKKLGKEGCGNLTCLKYQMVDSSAPDVQDFVWFDDKDYMLRKTRTETKDSGVSEATYSYGSVSIKAPSPTKETANLEDAYKNLSNTDLEQAQKELESQLNQYSIPTE